MLLGHYIKKIRKQQGRTLQEIADACDVTKSLLSKIENNHTVPSIATLMKVADCLGVNVASLMSGDDTNAPVYTSEDTVKTKPLIKTNKGYEFYLFASDRKEKNMQPFLITARKSEVKKHTLSHPGEEFLYVLEGEMNYRVGKTIYTLSKGDSLYFDAIEEHEVIPLSKSVHYLAIFVDTKSKN